MSTKTVTVPFSVIANVCVELTCAVPFDDDGEPDMGGMKIVDCRTSRICTVSASDVRESMGTEDFAELDRVVLAALADGKGR